MRCIRFSARNQTLRSGSPDIEDLPVLVCLQEDGTPEIISCWQLSLWERLQLLFTGRLFVHVLSQIHPPIGLSVENSRIRLIEQRYDELEHMKEASRN